MNARAYVNMGEAKVKDFMSPSTDIVKTRSGVIEVALRATSIVSSILVAAGKFSN